MEAAKGSFVAFATAPGSVAADGNGRNGIYTEQLLVSLKEPDGDIDKVFRRVAASVATVTDGKQIPWVASSLTGDFYFRRPPAVDDTKLKQAEQERAELARKLEDERKQRAQETAALKQRSDHEKASHAEELEKARIQREKDAEALRAEMNKLRAELQTIRAEAANRPMTPTAVSAVATAPLPKPAPSKPSEQPVQGAIAPSPPSPTSAPTSQSPKQEAALPPPPTAASAATTAPAAEPMPSTPPEQPVQVTIVTTPSPTPTVPPQPPQLVTTIAPPPAVTTAADEWKDRISALEKLHGQMTFSKAMAVLLDVKAEDELEALLKYQARLTRMPYSSAFALGVNKSGYLTGYRAWQWSTPDLANKTALDNCNSKQTEGSCRLVMMNGELQEANLLEVVARLGRKSPDFVRVRYLVRDLPKFLAATGW
jgi:hypothetical protein